jgi:hypothetical protein
MSTPIVIHLERGTCTVPPFFRCCVSFLLLFLLLFLLRILRSSIGWRVVSSAVLFALVLDSYGRWVWKYPTCRSVIFSVFSRCCGQRGGSRRRRNVASAVRPVAAITHATAACHPTHHEAASDLAVCFTGGIGTFSIHTVVNIGTFFPSVIYSIDIAVDITIDAIVEEGAGG